MDMVLLAHDLLRGDHQAVQSSDDRECGGYADAEHPGWAVSFGILLRMSSPLSRLSKQDLNHSQILLILQRGQTQRPRQPIILLALPMDHIESVKVQHKSVQQRTRRDLRQRRPRAERGGDEGDDGEEVALEVGVDEARAAEEGARPGGVHVLDDGHEVGEGVGELARVGRLGRMSIC